MHQHPPGTGWIEVICGPMFSGKTEELIRRIHRARYARQKVQIFKPAIDVRYDQTKVVSHNGREIPSSTIDQAAEIFDLLDPESRVVAIDEAQFLDTDTVRVARVLAGEGRRVIVAGLDQDYRGQPFETMMLMMVEAEYVTKNMAICLVCGAPAHRNQRLIEASGRVILGSEAEYEARCRRCFKPLKAEEDLLFEA
ncbi:MAG: thymidine kinase [Planctomycetes bacterium]|nr:thymidine kinase [Planctomycetota bacterium]